jgi:SIR2-like domain
MHFGCVDFPSKLVESRTAGNLVVFAGAGVSIPPPSNLPDFKKLAIELAQSSKTLEKGEPLDRFLGRLDPELRIHEHTRDRLRRPDSKPNPLHFSLLKLFGGASTVRLVTTNFDHHFAEAAAELWSGESPEIFAAPALPAGGDFLGLVHLHGSVTRDPKRMVLTDVDFGKAYLTEGWARRFLLEMFSKYAVIFVGYSHNDPVMHYLARGLPSSTEDTRFALTLEGQDIFAPAQLDLTIEDRFGYPVRPREWFLVPLHVIDEAVQRIRDGSIINVVYEPKSARLVER